MKNYSLEDKLKLNIRKYYFENDTIKSKIINYLNRLSYLSSDEKGEKIEKGNTSIKIKQKRTISNEHLNKICDFAIEKRPKIEQDEPTLTRNKRILQIGLFGHLKKAKDALEQEKNKKTIMLHNIQNKRVEEKIQKEKKKFEKSELEDIEKKIISYIKELKEIKKNIKHDEGKLMKINLINHYDKMKNFISTNTYPTIFWCPLKLNKKTKILLKNTENFIKKKIDAIKLTNYEVEFEEEDWLERFLKIKEKIKKIYKASVQELVESNNNEKDKNELCAIENDKESMNESYPIKEIKKNKNDDQDKNSSLDIDDKSESNNDEEDCINKDIDDHSTSVNITDHITEKIKDGFNKKIKKTIKNSESNEELEHIVQNN